MKKVEKYIYIVLIMILVGVIASGTTYILMKDNNKTEVKENNKEQDNKENETKEEKITLTESELKEYLSYVPTNDVLDNKYSTVTNTDNKILLGTILFNLTLDADDGAIIASLSKADELMQKMYNQKLGNYSDSYENGEWKNYVATYASFCYTKEDNNFIVNYCSSGSETFNLIESYEAKYDLLYIYSYHAYDSNEEIADYYNGYKASVNITDDYNNSFNNYLKENKGKFTKYKHIFKKNENGYYWYSTEVIK